MNVSRSNFQHTLPFIYECLRKSHFVALDFEMTGITAHPLLRNSNLDSTQLRYWKQKENVKRFLPIQMGLCSFEIVNRTNIIAYPFNFYIYPLPLESMNKTFLCAASALNFLSGFEFDFNKLIYDGITLLVEYQGIGIYYISHEEERMLEENKEIQKTKKALKELDKIISPEMHAFVNLYLPKVEDFLLRSEDSTLELEIQYIKFKVYKHLESTILSKFPHIPLEITYDSEVIMKRKKMIIKKLTQEELIAKNNEKALKGEDITADDYDVVGFRKVIDFISYLKLPLITHNGFLDILHLYDKFFNPLPETHKEFKMMFKKEFPIFYDTKYILSNSNIIANDVGFQIDLSSFYKALLKYHNQPPIIKIDENFPDYKFIQGDEDPQFAHEAGYDALITGYVFFKSLGILNMYDSLFDKTFVRKMKFFENRLPLGGIKVPFNTNYEEDYYKDNSLVFYIENKQTVLTLEEIKQYFETHFGPANLHQVFSDRMEYFLIFQQYDAGSKLKSLLDKTSGENKVKLTGKDGEGLLEIRSFEKYEETLKNKIATDLNGGKMPKIYDIIA